MVKLREMNEVEIPFAGFNLIGELIVPPGAPGVVLFAHGSGSVSLGALLRKIPSIDYAAMGSRGSKGGRELPRRRPQDHPAKERKSQTETDRCESQLIQSE